ncbi:MAG: hypothetical protein ACLQPD_18505 [Desulfomonilaceae bacterium]
MRIVFYRTVLVYLFAGLLAFATAPAVAQTTLNQGIPKTGPVSHKGPVENPREKGFSGEVKAGTDRTLQTKQAEGMKPANFYSRTKPGEATIARVDRSGNCLHVYTDPSVSSKEIACRLKGETIHLSGLFTKDRRWAQLDNKGWVLYRNLKTHVKVRRTAASNMSWGLPAAMGKGNSRIDRYSPWYNELNSGPIF